MPIKPVLNRAVCGWAAASLLLAPAAPVLAEPLDFPGGKIDDSRLDQGEIYIGQPTRAVAPSGCEVGDKYSTYVSAGQFDKVVDLFTDDAIVFHDGGPPMRGKAAISDFYSRRIGSLKVKLLPVAYAVGPHMCLMQQTVTRGQGDKPEYFSAAFTQFVLAADGRAKMMVAYGRRTPVVTGVISHLESSK